MTIKIGNLYVSFNFRICSFSSMNKSHRVYGLFTHFITLHSVIALFIGNSIRLFKTKKESLNEISSDKSLFYFIFIILYFSWTFWNIWIFFVLRCFVSVLVMKFRKIPKCWCNEWFWLDWSTGNGLEEGFSRNSNSQEWGIYVSALNTPLVCWK